MKLNKIIFKESIFLNNNEKKKYKSFSKKFDEIFSNFKSDIQNLKKTEYILNDNFKFNFNIKDLKKFKKFRTIALVGMGGSILGAEAIYNFFQKKIKKKFIFLITLMKIN